MLPCQHGMLCRYSARCCLICGICTISGITLLDTGYTSWWSRVFTGWMGGVVCPFRPKVKSRLMLRLRVHCGSCPILQHYTVLAHSCIPANTSVRCWYYSIISWFGRAIGRWNNGIGTYANDTNWVIRRQVLDTIWVNNRTRRRNCFLKDDGREERDWNILILQIYI